MATSILRGVCKQWNGLLEWWNSNDSWGVCSDENINSGAILSFDVVSMGLPVIIMLQKD